MENQIDCFEFGEDSGRLKLVEDLNGNLAERKIDAQDVISIESIILPSRPAGSLVRVWFRVKNK